MNDPVAITDLTVAPGVREVTSEDGAVLLDVQQGICFSLNPVGLRIWKLLKERSSREQIVESLAQEFSVPKFQLLSDVDEFVAALEAQHLVQQRGPDGASTKKGWFARIRSRR
jgi:hypothetical protein